MNDLLMARSQMAFSLGFHIIFASISMVLPFLMAWAYRNYLRKGDPLDLRLTKAWMRGAAILFATGAVSGTALSFQLGLLWPEFMRHAGPIIGMPFSLEGGAFFLEAIFLGLFFYGWDRVSGKWHLFFGVMVGLCGLASGILVVAANGWMNTPAGFDWINAQAQNISPWKAMFNKAWPLQALHMLIAAFQATSMAAVGLHALGLLRNRASEFHRRALGYLLPVLAISSFFQPLIGDFSAKSVAIHQPEKFAAMEAHFKTMSAAPLHLGGWPDEDSQTVKASIEIPYGLSFLAHGDFKASVTGLDAFPKNDWPPVTITHLSFQIMVGLGMIMMLLGIIFFFFKWKKVDLLSKPWWLKTLFVLSPIGFLALEAGWIVTEVGRQPWIIYHIMRTREALTPVPGLGWSFGIMAVVYACLGFLSFFLLLKWFAVESKRG